MDGRLTPPSIQDGEFGFEPGEVSNFDAGQGKEGKTLSNEDAKKIGQEVFSSSTDWINASRRSQWGNSLRSFSNLHPSGSKYLSGDYRFRSTLFRPKTRSMVRRDEAATAAAFFSNEDVVSVQPGDDDDPKQMASAEILKALLQYRLKDGPQGSVIPWFLTLVGARQDCNVMGICIAKVGWEYEERFLKTEKRPKMGDDGMPVFDTKTMEQEFESYDTFKRIKDRPFINLLAPENFRYDPGCDWRSPVESSPYLIELDPVYIQDAMERMEGKNGAAAQWNRISTSALRGASDRSDDTTRRAREAGRVPGKDDDAGRPADFDIAWTRLYTMRFGGRDWVFRTLSGSGDLVENPRPIEEVYLHGERPYTVGSVLVETHKTYPTSKVELTQGLQQAANQDWNSRFDAVMLGLQPRQFVREGSGVDINDLRTFMPAKVVMLKGKPGEPLQNDVTWDRPPPPDASSFEEQDRINVDWDDLAGAPNSVTQASQIQQQSATGMALMSGEASGLTEYELRVFAETWVEPTLRLLIKVLQAYETDPVILALAGKKAQLMERFGMDEITDELLNQGVTVRCNVGIGATNPTMKLKNFATGADILGKIFGPTAASGANFEEVSKEIFGLLGYKDGARFFNPGYDPRVAMLQEQIKKLQGGKNGTDPQDAQMKAQAAQQAAQAKVQTAQLTTQGKLQEQQMQSQTDVQVAHIDLQARQMEEQGETSRAQLAYQRELQTMQTQPVHPALKAAGL